MEKLKIKVDVSWTDGNFCCGWSDDNVGNVVVTAKSLEELKKNFEESMNLHIHACVEDGDYVPEYLANGYYEPEYILDSAALLRDAESYTTLAAISRASGINQKQLSHYASGLKHPRRVQMDRIRAGLRCIGAQLLALS